MAEKALAAASAAADEAEAARAAAATAAAVAKANGDDEEYVTRFLPLVFLSLLDRTAGSAGTAAAMAVPLRICRCHFPCLIACRLWLSSTLKTLPVFWQVFHGRSRVCPRLVLGVQRKHYGGGWLQEEAAVPLATQHEGLCSLGVHCGTGPEQVGLRPLPKCTTYAVDCHATF